MASQDQQVMGRVASVRAVKRVLITVNTRDCLDEATRALRPIAVVVVHEDGRRSQPVECRSVREARIYANGVCWGASLAFGDFGAGASGVRDLRDAWPVNAELDGCLVDVEG